MRMIRKFYKPEMEKIFNLVLPNINLNAFCKNPETYRFSWISRFLCDSDINDVAIPEVKPDVPKAIIYTENEAIDKNGDKLESKPEMTEEKYISENYYKTPDAVGYPGARDPKKTGAYANWPHLDTACPLTPNVRKEKSKTHRWPDGIGIGFPKCGTSAISFIDCHPRFVFRDSEPYFWASPPAINIGLIAEFEKY